MDRQALDGMGSLRWVGQATFGLPLQKPTLCGGGRWRGCYDAVCFSLAYDHHYAPGRNEQAPKNNPGGERFPQDEEDPGAGSHSLKLASMPRGENDAPGQEKDNGGPDGGGEVRIHMCHSKFGENGGEGREER